METQLENNYRIVDNIFSDKVLTLLAPYAKLLSTDKSSYDVWPSRATLDNTAPECFTCDVLGKDRIEIINELYNNHLLSCYGEKWLRYCDIAVQKLPIGGFIPKHTDHCVFSLTVFLSEVKGGEFHWWDSADNKHTVSSSVNRGIVSGNKTFKRGLSHEVAPVEEGVRFTLQLFVFDKKEKTNDEKGVIWEIEE